MLGSRPYWVIERLGLVTFHVQNEGSKEPLQHCVSENCVRSSTELLHSGLSLSNAVCASDWTCGLAHAKKIVSDNFSAGMECLC